MGLLSQKAKVFRAFGTERRLQILGSIIRGTSNPSESARGMGLPRSTVKKHIRVPLKAGFVEKVPSLNPSGQSTVYYHTTDIEKDLLKATAKILKQTTAT